MDWPGDLVNDTPRCLSLLRLQVACDDAAVGTGYLMFGGQVEHCYPTTIPLAR